MIRAAQWPIVWWLATLSLFAGATAILLATLWVQVPESWGFRGSSSLFAIACGTVGAVVGIRRPDNRVGWIFVAIGLLFATQAFINEYTIAAVLAVPGDLPGEPQIAWLLTWLWVPSVALALIFLPLLFPTGRLISPAWRPAAGFGVFATVILSIIAAMAPGPIRQATFVDNPFQPLSLDPGGASIVFAVFALPFMVAIGVAITSQVRRFRAADDEARAQIKWFALASVIGGSLYAFYILSSAFSPPPAITKSLEILNVLALLGLPIAAGVAILRYRLYDVDRFISRTIAYGAVSALLVATYAGVILLLQGPLGEVNGGQTIQVAISTLVVAGLFQPVRGRVQRVVDRRFDRARVDAERTSIAFSDRLRDEVDIATVTADLDATVRASLAPTSLGIWLRTGRAK